MKQSEAGKGGSVGTGSKSGKSPVPPSSSSSSTGQRRPRSLSNLNPLDQSTDPFKEGMFTTTRDYIESLSRKIVFQQQHQEAVASTGASVGGGKVVNKLNFHVDESLFDSRPYEAVFESTLGQLMVLKGHVERKMDLQAKECVELEKEYNSKLSEIQRKFDKMFKDFKEFDGTINKVSTSAQRIGGSLESVEASRNRAIETQVFLNYLVLLNDEDAKLYKIFGDTTEVENAIILKNLLILSAELDMPNMEWAKKNVEKMAESLEINQLERFIRASQDSKYSTMKECAKILFELNGGEECIKSYINQLAMFFQEDLEDQDTENENEILRFKYLDKFLRNNGSNSSFNPNQIEIKDNLSNPGNFVGMNASPSLEEIPLRRLPGNFNSTPTTPSGSSPIPYSPSPIMMSSSGALDSLENIPGNHSPSSSLVTSPSSMFSMLPSMVRDGSTGSMGGMSTGSSASSREGGPPAAHLILPPPNLDYPHTRLRILPDMDEVESNFIRIDRFYERVVMSVREEYEVIHKVFPIPWLVLMRLVQRVFEQRINSFIDAILSRSRDTGDLETYLKTLGYAVEKMGQVEKDLSGQNQMIGNNQLTGPNQPTPSSSTTNTPSHRNSVQQSTLSLVNSSIVANMNAQQLNMNVAAVHGLAEQVFVKHRDDFIEYQVESLKKKMVKEQEVEDDSDWAVGQRAAGKKVPWKAIDLSVDVTIRCLEAAQDAASRCALLSHPRMLAENMYKVFLTLIKEYGKKLMLVALDQAIKPLSSAAGVVHHGNAAPSSSFSLVSQFFSLVQSLNTNVVLLQKHYFVKIRPFIEGSRNEQSMCQTEKNKLLSMLEDQLQLGLAHSLTLLIAHLSSILSKEQRSHHFKPKPNQLDSINFQLASPACLAVCSFIKTQFHALSDALDGRNLQAFLMEFASKTLQVLLQHFKGYEIEHGIGAFCLMRDMSEYQECIATFGIPKLNADYQVLKAVAKLHLVKPEQLADVIADSPLAKWNKTELESFVKMRSDYDKSWLGKYY